MLRKTENLWKIVGCFWTWQNGVFWVCFFEGLMVIVVCFLCVWYSYKSVKNACCFPQFLGVLCGGLFLFILGLQGLGVLCVSCFCFSFVQCCLFYVLLLALVLFCCWVVVGVASCICFCLFVLGLFLCFWEGLRDRWGDPKGHLTWPFFVFFFVFVCCVCFLVCCFFCFCLEGLRVKWGGTKGHLTWP